MVARKRYLTKTEVKEAIKEERAERWYKMTEIFLYILLGLGVFTLIFVVPTMVAYRSGYDNGFVEGYNQGVMNETESMFNYIQNMSCGESFKILSYYTNKSTRNVFSEDCLFYTRNITFGEKRWD